MTSNAVLILKAFFSSAVKLLTSFRFPGTNATPLQLILFSSFVVILLRFFSKYFSSGDE